MIALEIDPQTGMVHRKDTMDLYVIKEVARCYSHLIMVEDDVVLDLGGNIGAFARFFSPSVGKIISCEPEPENFDILMRNVINLENVTPLQCAVIGEEGIEEVRLFLNGDKNKGSHSMCVQGGRESIIVPAVSLAAILKKYKPTVIKMDIEGMEYQLLNSCDLIGVRALAVEFHHTRKDYKAALPHTRARLALQGFEETVPFHITDAAWHKIGFYER